MLPPWKKYPKIKRFSIGWRMGDGEDYLGDWGEWYIKLEKQEKEDYRKKYPLPFMWWGFYRLYAS